MKTIRLESLELTNFKGIRSLQVDFYENVTRVYGANGVGKTTLFDAFVWVLFGKDSQDRKQFDIKTLDENGAAIPKIPHEVTAVLKVDGEKITLRRTYSEKWTKKRGALEEEFTGHEEERFYNNVPCSVKDWEAKMNAICPEYVFKYITNPRYYASQKPNIQRQILFEMAGNISDAQVASTSTEFESLLKELSGKTLEEYKKELAAKKRRIKAEAEGLPVRIDERRRDIETLKSIDFSEAERLIVEGEKRIEEINAAVADKSKLDEQISAKRSDIVRKITSLKIQLEDIKRQAISNASAEYDNAQAVLLNLKSERVEKQMMYEANNKTIQASSAECESLNKALTELGKEWDKIVSERMVFNEQDFICPTCGRRYEVSEIEGKQIEMTYRFNENRARRIEKNNYSGKELSVKIKAVKTKIADLTEDNKILANQIADLDERIAEKSNLPGKIDVEKVLAGVPEIRETEQRISTTEQSLKELDLDNLMTVDLAALNEEKRLANMNILQARETLSKRTEIARHEQRIAELEKQYKALAQELTRIEGVEFTASEFGRTKVSLIESAINALFSHVKFKMFDTQVNGQVVETCEATVGGVPYSSANNAAQIHAGVDIINAICQSKGIEAPIFLDNAEGLNDLPDTASQVVALYVTSDNQLIIS